MRINAKIINNALSNLADDYIKILFVNLTNDTYDVGIVPDDEVDCATEFKSLSEYFDWFVANGFVHPDDADLYRDFLKKADAGKQIIYRRKLSNEQFRWVLMELSPLSDYSKDSKVCALYVKDIHNVYSSRYDSLIESIGVTDGMTKLFNRIGFDRDIKNLKGYVGIVFADLNALKWTNDNLGHKAGDECIIQFANLLKINFSNSKCYHISGDEFVVVSQVKPRDFLKTALIFHKSLWSNAEYPSASVGYSLGDASEINGIIEDAEEMMYADKMIFYARFPKFKR